MRAGPPPARRPRGLRALVVVLLLVVASGCLSVGGCTTFDGQTVVLRHDSTLDTLDVLLVYRGLRAAGPMEDAVAQLRKARGQRVVALGSPLLCLDVDGVMAPEGAPREPSAFMARLQAALAGLLVLDQGLWQDSAGRLCGAQRVRLTGVTNVLDQVNAALRDSLLTDARWLRDLLEELGLGAPEDMAEVQRLLSAAPSFDFLALKGAAVTLSLPLAPEQQARVRAAVLAGLARLETRAEAGDGDAAAQRRFLLEHDVSIATDGTGLHLVIGDPAQDELVLQWPVERPLDTNLAEALRAERWEIGAPEAEEAVRASFDAPLVDAK